MVPPKSEYLSEVWRDGIFKDKVVFCTGGAGTICSAQVRALVHLGANACIVGRNPEKTTKMAADISYSRRGSRVLGLGNVDVRKFEDLQKAVEKCVAELGAVDFLIAGAAGNFLAPLNQLSPNAFKSVIDIDVLGSFHAVKACLPYLVESAQRNPNDGTTSRGAGLTSNIANTTGTGGRVIFVSATLHYAGNPLQTHVMAAKAAVDALSNALCIEQGPFGITSNVISPGPIEGTEGMERLSVEGGRTRVRPSIPTGRLGLVKEIADSTIYLFSEAGNYCNGQTLVVDGGHWRTASTSDHGFAYPDFLTGGLQVEGVKGMKTKKDAKL